MSKNILFISPHFDDAAFSCGGNIQKLVRSGHSVHLLTVFTKSKKPFNSFAKECQLSKGIPIEEDYLSLRAKENVNFAKFMGINNVVNLDFLEAPYRGYESSKSLFLSDETKESSLIDELTEKIKSYVMRFKFDQIYSAAALGNHIDHLLVRSATQKLYTSIVNSETSFYLYEDLPYAINSESFVDLETFKESYFVDIDISETIEDKVKGILEYTSQIGFQFGDPKMVDIKVKTYSKSLSSEDSDVYIERCYQADDFFALKVTDG